MTVRRLDGAQESDGVTLDISADGIYAAIALDAVGDDVHVALSVPDREEPLRARARVVRRENGLLAMHFAAHETGARARLASLVLEHNRSVLRQRHAAALRRGA